MKKDTDIASEFSKNYDEVIGKVCKPYHRFIKIAADAVPEDIASVCDIGIGTGNLSFAIQQRLPSLTVHGVDLNPSSLEKARQKFGVSSALRLYQQDAFNVNLPTADYYVSSLTFHHLEAEEQKRKLLEIAQKAQGFIHLDLMLSNGRNTQDVTQEVLSYARRHFPEAENLRRIRDEIMEKDRPLPIKEHAALFLSHGLKFTLLAHEFPFAVYHVTQRQ